MELRHPSNGTSIFRNDQLQRPGFDQRLTVARVSHQNLLSVMNIRIDFG